MIPVVSVVMPAYNAAGTLRTAVRSLQDQSVPDWELIIIDDGSTDDTAGVAEEIALGDQRIWVLRQDNKGVSAARNLGIDGARGEWVSFLDADDWLLPGALRRLLDAAGARDASAGRSLLVSQFERSLDFETGPAPTLEPGACIGLSELLTANRFQPAASLVRRELLHGVRFDTALTAAEDWDFWLRLAERSVKWSIVDAPIAAYRLRPGGLSRAYAVMAEQSRRVIERAFDRARAQHQVLQPPGLLRRENLCAVVARITLSQATASALNDASESLDDSWFILASHWPGGHASPADLAEAAYWMIPFADGLAPSAWGAGDAARLRTYLSTLHRLWGRMRREGLTTAGAKDEALELLAARIVDPAQIAGALAKACSHGPVTMLGFGANARHLAVALAHAGIAFDARDDNAPPGLSRREVDGVSVGVQGPGAPYDTSRTHIMTVADDEAYLAKLPGDVRPLRWRDARARLARDVWVSLAAQMQAGESNLEAAA